ncbi:MAG TPA: adenylate/guanylate cyclase domain-containing protein [bacterium]
MPEERRLVTVLFADVTGSTELGESLDPEDARALLARFYAIAQEIVPAFGGTLEKFIGDAVMAVFGLPRAHGDDAQRAVTAALALRDRVRADPGLGERLPIRVGVNSGEVVATRDPAASDFLVTGDAVNVAARLQQAAEPWAILCGERTVRALAGEFSVGPVVEIDAKGKAAPVKAVPVLGRAARAVPRRLPLIGRETDLAHLELIARRVFTERRPFLVSLIAPAGTGKTRLLEEFLERLPAVIPHATVAIAQCLPYGQRLTYWPLRSMLFQLVGIPDDASPAVARDAVRAWTADAGVPDATRVADLLAATVGAAEAEVIDRDAVFGAWRTLIETAARRRPLVAVFEDLHWSSDSLLDLVEFVMQPRGDAPVLIVALTRPELLDRRRAWGGGRRNYASLALEPLSDESIAELVEQLLGRSAPELVATVVSRTEGNPFYAGEMVRSVLDRAGSLEDDAAVARALAEMPDTVQATVLARLDLLEPAERRILQMGAVFGRTFRLAGVAALERDPEGDDDELLDRLIEKDLIRPADGDGFSFRHILIREVAYQTLPRAERARLHAAAGTWLEQHATGREDEVAELIAYHYREAATVASGLHTREDAGSVRQQAVRWLSRAASVADAAGAQTEALRHLQAALELAEPEEHLDLYERIGNVYTGGTASVQAYQEALKLAREAGRPVDQQLRILSRMLMVYMRSQGSVANRPTVDEMNAMRAEGRALLPQAADERVKAAFLIADAFYPFWRRADTTPEEAAAAEIAARDGLAIAERLDDANLRSAALDALSGIAQNHGDWSGAHQLVQERLAFQARLNLLERVDAYSMATWTAVMLGNLEEADDVSAAGLALVQPGQVPAWTLHLQAWRAYALLLRGRWDETLRTVQRARQLWHEAGRISAGYATRGFFAGLDVARAREDDELIAEITAVVEEIGRQFDQFARGRDRTSNIRMAYLRMDVNQLESALQQFAELYQINRFGVRFAAPVTLELYERTLSLFADQGLPVAVSVAGAFAEIAERNGCRLLEASTRRALGVATRDASELSRALDLYVQTGAIPYEARARCDRALLTGDEGEVAAGLRVLERLGDIRQIGRVEQRWRQRA